MAPATAPQALKLFVGMLLFPRTLLTERKVPMKLLARLRCVRTALGALLVCSAGSAFAQPAEPVFSLAKKEHPRCSKR